ncbi:hypothetical protein ACHQM5_022614 [Ranunculus cassubicifolius]
MNPRTFLIILFFFLLSSPCISALTTPAPKHEPLRQPPPIWWPDNSVVTYAISPQHTITRLTKAQIQTAVDRAFATWAAVIPAKFNETAYYDNANIKIGFYEGDPFHGPRGVLGWGYSDNSGGTIHLNAETIWVVDFRVEKSKIATDLESIVVHEIGHVLELNHSLNSHAVMYGHYSFRKKRANLDIDDVNKVQAIYGSNPNFKLDDLHTSSGSARLGFNYLVWNWFTSLLCLVYCSHFST